MHGVTSFLCPIYINNKIFYNIDSIYYLRKTANYITAQQ